jgi:hypothetical protein
MEKEHYRIIYIGRKFITEMKCRIKLELNYNATRHHSNNLRQHWRHNYIKVVNVVTGFEMLRHMAIWPVTVWAIRCGLLSMYQ